MADQHKVLRTADGRVIDFAFGDTGFDTPARLTAKQAATAGSVIETFAGDLPTDIQRGYAIDAAGAVSVPATETTNELLEARRSVVSEWVIAEGANIGLMHYARFQSNPRARAWEAVQRMVYYRTHSNEALQNDAWWNKMLAMTALKWRNFVWNMTHNADGWETSNGWLNGMRAGNTWRLVEVDSDTGRYTLVIDPAGAPPYTYQGTHAEAYWDLITSARV